MRPNPLKQIVTKQKQGKGIGIYSCCSANEYVIKAAIAAAKQDQSCVLIEATANQVDQNGGYTGMNPKAFRRFVYAIAETMEFPTHRIFLGGDHLGPLTFSDQKESEAMIAASELVRGYVEAGFIKIHIDTSMKLADDDPEERLKDEVIARRAALLVQVCEDAYQALLRQDPDAVPLVYVIGSEVPIPGGAQKTDQALAITKVNDFRASVEAFYRAFQSAGLSRQWDDVIAVVVQPGMEEKDDGCVAYDRQKAAELTASIRAYDQLVFEGHSSDYQTKTKLRELVEDGVAVLKVGPALTYALREALFALSYIEEITFHGREAHVSKFRDALDQAMCEDRSKWQKHYHGNDDALWMKRQFSFSDRCRYYMGDPKVSAAREILIANLRKEGISLSLLSQFLPIQYQRVREGILENDPEALILDHIGDTIRDYLYATRQKELFD